VAPYYALVTITRRILCGALLALTVAACAPARQAAEEQRRDAAAAIDEKLREMDQRMERLRALRGHHDLSVQKELRELEEVRQQLRTEADEARRSGGRTLQDVEAAVDRTMERIEKAIGASS